MITYSRRDVGGWDVVLDGKIIGWTIETADGWQAFASTGRSEGDLCGLWLSRGAAATHVHTTHLLRRPRSSKAPRSGLASSDTP